jgi:hypothetical protein
VVEPCGTVVCGDHNQAHPTWKLEQRKELEGVIMDYFHRWNESGKRFVQAKSSEEILARIRRAVRN